MEGTVAGWVRVRADYHRGPYAQGWDMVRVWCDGSIARR